MRWWRREGIGGLGAVARLGLFLGGVLVLAGCASSSTTIAEAYASAARIGAAHGDQAGEGTAAKTDQAAAERSEPAGGSPPSGRRGPLAALLSGLLGPPPHVSSAIDEEALIARAIAEHEMRKP